MIRISNFTVINFAWIRPFQKVYGKNNNKQFSYLRLFQTFLLISGPKCLTICNDNIHSENIPINTNKYCYIIFISKNVSLISKFISDFVLCFPYLLYFGVCWYKIDRIYIVSFSINIQSRRIVCQHESKINFLWQWQLLICEKWIVVESEMLTCERRQTGLCILTLNLDLLSLETRTMAEKEKLEYTFYNAELDG
jgi:hypothetical protein